VNPSDPPIDPRFTQAAEAQQAAILQLAATNKGPDRRRTLLAHVGIILFGPVLLAVLLQLLGGYTQGDRPLPFVVGTSAGWVTVALACGWLALRRDQDMLGTSTRTLVITAGLAPVALFGWLLLWNRFYLPDACPPGVSSWGTSCHQLIIAMSAVMFSAFATVRRFGDPVHPKATGAVMGVSAAAAAGMVINLRCSCATPLHVGFGHVLPLAVAALAGVGFGAWLLRLRRRVTSPSATGTP
jgi:hypothetical protein